MVRTIKIGNKSYDLKSSAFTIFAYKNKTGRDMLNDITLINDKYNEISKYDKDKQDSLWLKEIMPIIDVVLDLAYIMIKEQNPSFVEKEDWLKDIDTLFDDFNWVMDVMEVGLSPFFGRLQSAAYNPSK